MSKILTISIAAFNVEKYIRETLTSLCDDEVIDDLEIFVIDDDGKDHTLEIAKEFANKYPKLSVRARSIHTYEDTEYNTSYETYLRGEISTYSDKMLQLFAGFVAGLLKEERNLSFIIMENTAKLYGYDSLETLNKAYDK